MSSSGGWFVANEVLHTARSDINPFPFLQDDLYTADQPGKLKAQIHTIYSTVSNNYLIFPLFSLILAGCLVCGIPMVRMVASAKEHFATREKCSHWLCSLSLAPRQEISFADCSKLC